MLKYVDRMWVRLGWLLLHKNPFIRALTYFVFGFVCYLVGCLIVGGVLIFGAWLIF